MREQYVEAVLAVVDLIPLARVLSYGDIAALLETGGPRQVGAVMSSHGGAVSWWRVVRSNGAAPTCHENTALVHYRRERTPLRGGGPAGDGLWGIDMKSARWTPGPAQMAQIDALVAALRDADDAGHGTPAPSRGTGRRMQADAPPMSVPRGGLKA